MFIPFLRLSEPYFYQILYKKFRANLKRLCRYREQIQEKYIERARGLSNATDTSLSSLEDDDDEVSEMAPLFFFLASSLNTELVYIMLESVKQFSFLLAGNKGAQNDEE